MRRPPAIVSKPLRGGRNRVVYPGEISREDKRKPSGRVRRECRPSLVSIPRQLRQTLIHTHARLITESLLGRGDVEVMIFGELRCNESGHRWF